MTKGKQGGIPQVRPNIRAVARLAKVSSATVSRTINNVPTVDPRLSNKVKKAVAELGFSPNAQARGLVSGRSRLLGLIVSEITNPFSPELIQGFEDSAVECGYEILVGSTNNEAKRVEICVQRMLERKVDGVAVMTFGVEAPLLHQLAALNLPLVFVDISPKGSQFSTIEVDYFHGIREAVQHLAVLGHRKIAFISGPTALRSAEARKSAFLRAMAEIGCSPQAAWMREGNHSLEGGIAATETILRTDDYPTAIMTSNDMTAIGVLHALHKAGHRVPQDFSVVGFDDVDVAKFTFPPLTSVLMSRWDLARCAVQALRNHLELSPNPQPEQYKVETRLIVRQSTDSPVNGIRRPRVAE